MYQGIRLACVPQPEQVHCHVLRRKSSEILNTQKLETVTKYITKNKDDLKNENFLKIKKTSKKKDWD